MPIQSLPWDSAFFGYAVSRLNILGNDVSEDILKNELFDGKDSNYDVCYIYVYHNSDTISSFLHSAGAILYDHKVTFRKDLISFEDCDPDKIVLELKELTQEAIDIAISSGLYSRFYLDPHFKSKQPMLYKQWINNCFEHNNGKVFGINQNDELAAIAGSSVSGGVGHLELIAVHPNYRRRGFAKRLIHAAERFFLNSGAVAAEVVTQLNNSAACKTYQSCEYSMIETVDVWHFWKSKKM